VKLETQVHGEAGDRPPLLIAHGLFGSARNWGAIARALSAERQVVAVDMRNHGSSPWDERHDYVAMAEDLAGVIGGGRWDVLGHSMGGKAAMVLALTHPGTVTRLIVADIAPVAYGHSQAHLVEAMQALDLSTGRVAGDADRALSERVEDAGVRAFLLQSLDVPNRVWRLNLPVLGGEMPKILSFPEDRRTLRRTGLLSHGIAVAVRVARASRAESSTLFPRARFAVDRGRGPLAARREAARLQGRRRRVPRVSRRPSGID
jgi:esterase